MVDRPSQWLKIKLGNEIDDSRILSQPLRRSYDHTQGFRSGDIEPYHTCK